MKGELPEGADRLAVAVRERGVGSLRGEAANSPEGGAGAGRKELRAGGWKASSGKPGPEIRESREERRCSKPRCWRRAPGGALRTEAWDFQGGKRRESQPRGKMGSRAGSHRPRREGVSEDLGVSEEQPPRRAARRGPEGTVGFAHLEVFSTRTALAAADE